ncbi:MAG: queuosine salvage family protein, partial [Solirubrobacteraceae bacterium]
MRIHDERISAYAASLPAPEPFASAAALTTLERARVTAFWLTLDAINFGSGWFPTLRKRREPTGYRTIVAGVRRQFDEHGPWSASELCALTAAELAAVFDQEPEHELMALFAASLRDLGTHLLVDCHGVFTATADAARGSAVALVGTLAGWECFADVSRYGGWRLAFLKRAQIAAADLHRAGVAR